MYLTNERILTAVTHAEQYFTDHPERWIQRKYVRFSEYHCLVGACMRGLSDNDIDTTEMSRGLQSVRAKMDNSGFSTSIEQWNDAPGRTVDQVIALLRRIREYLLLRRIREYLTPLSVVYELDERESVEA